MLPTLLHLSIIKFNWEPSTGTQRGKIDKLIENVAEGKGDNVIFVSKWRHHTQPMAYY